MDISDLKLFGKEYTRIMLYQQQQKKMKKKTAGIEISSQAGLHAS